MSNESRMQLVEDAMTLVAEGLALPYEHNKYGMSASEFEVCKPGMLRYARYVVTELSKSTAPLTARQLERCAYIMIESYNDKLAEDDEPGDPPPARSQEPKWLKGRPSAAERQRMLQA